MLMPLFVPARFIPAKASLGSVPALRHPSCNAALGPALLALPLALLLMLLPAVAPLAAPVQPARQTAAKPTKPAIVEATTPTRTLRVLSLNAEHLMSRARFERWRAFCSAHHWQAPPAGQRPPELTYCDALNGRNQRGQLVHGPLRQPEDLAAKISQLGRLIRQADPDLLLLQEVSDREAVRALLDETWVIHTSEERWPGHPMPQHVAIAWPKGRFQPAPRISLISKLSERTEAGHPTRPGLAALLDLGSELKLSILTVHLKAGCRQGRLDRSNSRQPARYWKRRDACQTLQAQIPALEDWLDAQILAGHQVLIAGDFNRDLRAERKAGLPARADGSPASAPIPPGDRAAASRISSLLAELDDDVPPGSRLHLVASGPYRKLADCHRHITPFLLSQGLAPFLSTRLDALQVQVIPFEAPISLAQPRPSDHCPHLLVLPLHEGKVSPTP